MADSLFGLTPEAVRQAQQQAAQSRGIALAQLDPLQAARAGMYQSGYLLGGGLSGLMGGVNPEVQRAQEMQTKISNFDLTTPDGVMAAAAAMRDKPEIALQLAQKAQQMRTQAAQQASEEALTKQREREKLAADPLQKILTSGKYTPASVAAYEKSKNIADLVPVEKDVAIKYSIDAEEIAAATYDKPFGALTPTERIKVLQTKQENELKAKQAGASKISLSAELKQAPAIAAAVDSFDKTVAPWLEQHSNAKLSKTLINEASKANNSQTWEAARTTIAKAIGENKLSNEDIRRTGVDPRLVQGALDWVNKKVSGVPNQDIMKQLYSLSTIVEDKAADQINAKADRARTVAKASKFEGDVDTYFPKIPKRAAPPVATAPGAVPAQATRTTKSGVQYTVD